MAVEFDGGLTCSMGVADLDRSIAWYSDVLGMKLIYRREDIAWCEFQSAVERVKGGLSEVEEAGGKGGATLTFGVRDIDAAKTVLDRHGVRQDGDVQEIPDLVRLLTFFDPDDNALMFYEDRQQNHG